MAVKQRYSVLTKEEFVKLYLRLQAERIGYIPDNSENSKNDFIVSENFKDVVSEKKVSKKISKKVSEAKFNLQEVKRKDGNYQLTFV